MLLPSLFNTIVVVCLTVLLAVSIVKILTIEKYIKKNQNHIAGLLQIEIDRLSKEK